MSAFARLGERSLLGLFVVLLLVNTERSRGSMSLGADRDGTPISAIAVVIPAHNEASVIGRSLRSLLESARPGEFDVVVVTNGSTDATAEKARLESDRLGYPVRVVELAAASKIKALRAADDLLGESAADVRIYLDADVVVTTAVARALAAALETDGPALALAKVDVDLEGASWIVRRYYRVWNAMPYVRHQVSGSGVFAVNGRGRARIGGWPDVINDDAYVSRQFAADERYVIDSTFRIYAARSARALIRRRARLVNGNRELDRRYPASIGINSVGGLRTAVRSGDAKPLDAVTFAFVTAAARLLAAWRRLRHTGDLWATDTTTRQAAA
jgi:glycosyltransferase involved in cell wall biosynthesis